MWKLLIFAGKQLEVEELMWTTGGGGVLLGACGKLLIFAGKQLEVEELMWLFK
jgi:hypothetical protein